MVTSNSLIDGSNLFCLQEYKCSFTASKIWFANSLCSHLRAKHIFLPAFAHFTTKETSWRWNNDNFAQKAICYRALIEWFLLKLLRFWVQGNANNNFFFPFQSLLSKTSLNFLLSKWWSDDCIPKFLVNCFRDIFFIKELKPTLNKKCDSIRAKLFV